MINNSEITYRIITVFPIMFHTIEQHIPYSNGFRMSHILTPSLALAVASILGSVGLNMTEWKALLYCASVSMALLLRMS